MLTGTFTRSIDQKSRVAIPKRLRAALESSPDGCLYLAPGTDKSLALYTEEEFSRLADRMEAMSPTQPDVRAFARLFYTAAQRVELDRQGRVRLTPELAAWAELSSEAVLLGVRDHVELWSPERWNAYQKEQQVRYDEISERAFGSSDS